MIPKLHVILLMLMLKKTRRVENHLNTPVKTHFKFKLTLQRQGILMKFIKVIVKA